MLPAKRARSTSKGQDPNSLETLALQRIVRDTHLERKCKYRKIEILEMLEGLTGLTWVFERTKCGKTSFICEPPYYMISRWIEAAKTRVTHGPSSVEIKPRVIFTLKSFRPFFHRFDGETVDRAWRSTCYKINL
jgi:hypothetical protein